MAVLPHRRDVIGREVSVSVCEGEVQHEQHGCQNEQHRPDNVRRRGKALEQRTSAGAGASGDLSGIGHSCSSSPVTSERCSISSEKVE